MKELKELLPEIPAHLEPRIYRGNRGLDRDHIWTVDKIAIGFNQGYYLIFQGYNDKTIRRANAHLVNLAKAQVLGILKNNLNE